MGLTITNTNTLSLLHILTRNTTAQSNTLMQLSTGFRINKASDDPAGLIAATSLTTELTAIDAALGNNQRTNSLLSVADGGMSEIGSLLTEIESLVARSTSASGLSAAEIAANQAQIDNALDAIDRIATTTTFNGLRLLDGTNAIETTGVDSTRIDSLKVYSRSQSTSDTSLTITRVGSAITASAVLMQGLGQAGATSGSTEMIIAGNLGTAHITFASSTTKAEIITLINAAKDQTGISAVGNTATLNSSIQLNSTTYGTDAFVSVEVLSGGTINSTYGTATSDSNTGNDLKDTAKRYGIDATISINSNATAVDGLDVNYNNGDLSLSFSLDETFGNGGTVGTTTTFTVKAKGGATFQLGTTASTRETIGIDSLATFRLGGGDAGALLRELKSGGAADMTTDVATALNTVKKAIGQVANVRGRIGGFQKYQVQSAIRNLETTKVGLEDARSAIRDTDYAVATARLNQQTVLTQTTISLLGLANQQSALILALLG